jgi:hypothetical protein
MSDILSRGQSSYYSRNRLCLLVFVGVYWSSLLTDILSRGQSSYCSRNSLCLLVFVVDRYIKLRPVILLYLQQLVFVGLRC